MKTRIVCSIEPKEQVSEKANYESLVKLRTEELAK